MADRKDQTATGEKQKVEQDTVDKKLEQQNDSSLAEEIAADNETVVKDQTTAALNDESALLDHEPIEGDQEQQQNESSLLEENDVGDESQSKEPKSGDAALDKSEHTAKENDAKSGVDEEEEEEETVQKDSNEIPQVNVATLAKRKWQIKVYPLKPNDFANGQISRVFSNARESLLFIHSSGRYSGGKGEMYVSSEVQAARVVQNLMSLDFKSQNINIEIIRKNNDGVVEEKAFMRFDAKLVRILCVPVIATRRMGTKRERIIGSVFVKNLPQTTSKEMLRVMFPFAPEINYNPQKFHDGTARLVLSTRSAVAPCLKAFSKVELGETLLELRPLQKRTKSESKTGDKSNENEESDDTKKDESKEEDTVKSESESKSSDTKKEEKDKQDSKKGSSANRSIDGKKEKGGDKDQRTDTRRTNSSTNASRGRRGNFNRDQGGNRNWRNNRDQRSEGGPQNMRNRFRGGNIGQRVDRNRLRPSDGFDNRNRYNERRMRPGLPGASGDVGINTGAANEMIILQSQLSMAIKNQLSMLSQTNLALEQAKREAVDLHLSRDLAAQGSSSELLNKRMSDQLSPEQARRAQLKTGLGNRRQQNKRGRPRDRRQEELLAGGDYGYKRNADVAGLPVEYGTAGYGKRRSAGLAAQSESPSWADDRNASAFLQAQPPAFAYEPEFDERELEYRRMQASLNQTYGQGSYGYRY